ncbi:Schizosaccharomyces pombe specific protein [Schizosaccharomyces pombe]|uniref:Uncharacterized protein C212.02 n=2 Tax=Schizosaccharomyces pombe (strain 972 / ATCC 24843) TaxID=284812 RepID=YM02_SCHPO|nr:uncharacterized protein SPAC212.02 [Schizosaccharomyces pombe]Q9HGQ0.1 RecName: Full=Uncharacterized protein C212.02 [Schizosaccharomyces pombe 972h-]CAC05736.1 sequence orphan [Schizosaccharomyces pombe]|eukprot:NP_595036.1 uncharacterized protein SPAC212.02 [Schizosaccharomyces pombe]
MTALMNHIYIDNPLISNSTNNVTHELLIDLHELYNDGEISRIVLLRTLVTQSADDATWIINLTDDVLNGLPLLKKRDRYTTQCHSTNMASTYDCDTGANAVGARGGATLAADYRGDWGGGVMLYKPLVVKACLTEI